MKAVIMAGGKGTRLRPLTWHLPKPMVPLLDRPCMEYIIDLLKRYGITEIAVTVQYLPQVIKNHFGDGSDYGVSLHFFEETTPLGTAGSVKNAEDFLDDTFLVISGDALTDFNLQQAVEFHKAKQAIGTLVLTRVEVPIEYGVVMTREDGKITRFLEKPSWSEVFSDTVNTGIYVLNPDIFRFFDKGREFDFSKDLFPLLMKYDYPLYGYVADGYWSDIGNLVQYRQSQFDMLQGLVDVNIRGNEVRPRIWVGENVTIHPTAHIEGPAFIGGGTVLDAGVKLNPYTVAGRYNRLERGASLERAVVWNRASIGPAATLEGATLCSGVNLGIAAQIHENAVVGDNSHIGDKAVVHANVKIWPGKHVESETIQRTSLIWGNAAVSRLFDASGITGIANVDVTPEFVSRVASAYGSCLKSGATVTVSCDDDTYSSVLRYSVIGSLLASGIHVLDIGTLLHPMARFSCRTLGVDGGVHIQRLGRGILDKMLVQFFDAEGRNIDKGFERKIENAFYQEDFARPDVHSLGSLEHVTNISKQYTREILSEVNLPRLKEQRLKVVYTCETASAALLMHALLEQIGCFGILMLDNVYALAQTVVDTQAHLGVHLDAGCQVLHVCTEEGALLNSAELDGLLADSWLSAEMDAFHTVVWMLNRLANQGTLSGLVGRSSPSQVHPMQSNV